MQALGLLLILLLALPQAGCTSFSALQTARTLKPGRASYQVAGGYETLAVQREDHDELDDVKLPVIEFGLRYGVRDSLDVGFKTTLLGTYMADAKYKLLDSGRFALATGAGVGYQRLSVGPSEDRSTVTMTELHLPLYSTVGLTDTVDTYLAPRYVYRLVSGAASTSLAGASVGIVAGRSVAVVLEASYFKPLGSAETVQQVMLGAVFGEDNLDRKKHRGKN